VSSSPKSSEPAQAALVDGKILERTEDGLKATADRLLNAGTRGSPR